MLNDEKRGLEEAYTTAAHSSNLRCETREDAPRSDAHILIAAGWSQARVGGALLRLHTEYDSAEHPRLARAQDFHGTGANREQRQAAAQKAHAFNLHETGLLLGKLKTLPAVRRELELQLTAWGVAEPATVGVGVLRWWLSQTCPACEGRKFEVVAGTARLAGKMCKACGGAGTSRVPHGEAGKRLANWMDGAVQIARARIAQGLRNSMGR